MTTKPLWLLTLAAAAAAYAQEPPAKGPGWTGLTHADDVIHARQELMLEMERLMRPIDSYAAGEPADDEELRSAAQTIHHIALALPHLFPPTTNRYDPSATEPATLALPAIWDNFPAFYAMALATSDAAAALAETQEKDALAGAATRLRATCDACHAPYLRPYVPATVTEEDLEFDFDSVFEQSNDE